MDVTLDPKILDIAVSVYRKPSHILPTAGRQDWEAIFYLTKDVLYLASAHRTV